MNAQSSPPYMAIPLAIVKFQEKFPFILFIDLASCPGWMNGWVVAGQLQYDKPS